MRWKATVFASDRVCRKYSKEIEHSDVNLSRLEQCFREKCLLQSGKSSAGGAVLRQTEKAGVREACKGRRNKV